MTTARSLSFGIALLLHAAVQAHGTAHGQHHLNGPYPVEQQDFGIAGHPKRLDRTVIVELRDEKRFSPNALRVKQGDTIRFVLRNTDRVRHEWALGTEASLQQQAQARRAAQAALPEAVHMLHVDPGQTEEVVWQFNRAGSFRFASLAPGQMEAGMVGTVTVDPGRTK